VSTRRGRLAGDDGTGMIGSTMAIVVFLFFLLFAVQLLFGLYARSVVTSVAYDGARAVAGHRADRDGGPGSAGARDRAEARMVQQLGSIGTHASFDWSGSDDDTISLRVRVDAPRFLSVEALGPLATDRIDRTVTARVERAR
jgi:hypothetical protein